MWRILFSIGLVGCFLVSLGTSQFARAICTDDAEVSCATDTGSCLPVSQTYDPCDDWLTWHFKWIRNDNDNNLTKLGYYVVGCSVTETYDSRNIAHGTHGDYSAQKYCGPSSQHTLSIHRIVGSDPHSTDLWAHAHYDAGSPGRRSGR